MGNGIFDPQEVMQQLIASGLLGNMQSQNDGLMPLPQSGMTNKFVDPSHPFNKALGDIINRYAEYYKTPGGMLQGQYSNMVQPDNPGQWSDRDEARAAGTAGELNRRGLVMGLDAMTGGMPLAQQGTVGAFGGRLPSVRVSGEMGSAPRFGESSGIPHNENIPSQSQGVLGADAIDKQFMDDFTRLLRGEPKPATTELGIARQAKEQKASSQKTLEDSARLEKGFGSIMNMDRATVEGLDRPGLQALHDQVMQHELTLSSMRPMIPKLLELGVKPADLVKMDPAQAYKLLKERGATGNVNLASDANVGEMTNQLQALRHYLSDRLQQ